MQPAALKQSLCTDRTTGHPITFLKRSKPGEGEGLYERARAMEAAKYAVGGDVAPEGAAGMRCSPRLAEMQGEMG